MQLQQVEIINSVVIRPDVISSSHVISQRSTNIGLYALFLLLLTLTDTNNAFFVQVLWWSWASHPLSPQVLSCSCWLVQRSLRWETPPRTEPSSMELRNVGFLLTIFAILRKLDTNLWNYFFWFPLKITDTYSVMSNCCSCQLHIMLSFFSQCLEW